MTLTKYRYITIIKNVKNVSIRKYKIWSWKILMKAYEFGFYKEFATEVYLDGQIEKRKEMISTNHLAQGVQRSSRTPCVWPDWVDHEKGFGRACTQIWCRLPSTTCALAGLYLQHHQHINQWTNHNLAESVENTQACFSYFDWSTTPGKHYGILVVYPAFLLHSIWHKAICEKHSDSWNMPQINLIVFRNAINGIFCPNQVE